MLRADAVVGSTDRTYVHRDTGLGINFCGLTPLHSSFLNSLPPLLDNVLVRAAPTPMSFLSTFVCVSLLFLSASAAIGPSADLYIVNEYISPDGYNRS